MHINSSNNSNYIHSLNEGCEKTTTNKSIDKPVKIINNEINLICNSQIVIYTHATQWGRVAHRRQ